MSAPPMLRVGVIGAGANTRKLHIPLLQKLPGVAVTHVANRSPESSARVAGELAIPHACTPPEILGNPAIDAVVIGTWPYKHCEYSVRALRAGKHVLTEARMAMDVPEALEMLEAAQANPHLVAQIVPSPFTLRFDATVKRLLDSGYLGQLLAVEVTGCPGSFADLDPSQEVTWRQSRELSGNNVMTMGIFVEALMRWIGPASTVVAASSRVFADQKLGWDGKPVRVEIPDHLDIIADFECGCRGHMQFSSVTGLRDNCNEFWLFGTDGTLHLSVSSGKLRAGKKGEKLQDVQPPPTTVSETSLANGWRVEEEFVGAIRGKERVKHTSFLDGLAYMRFTDAVALALQTKGAVQVSTASAPTTRRAAM